VTYQEEVARSSYQASIASADNKASGGDRQANKRMSFREDELVDFDDYEPDDDDYG